MENTNPTPSRHLKHVIEDFATRWWLWEIIASIVSIIFLASIFIVFYHYDNQPLDNWSLTWRFTSVVSFITTIAQISMLIPITAGISQLKWLWYNEKHSLADIEKFDQAARGPSGAVFLIFSYPFKQLASFGAFLTVVTVIFHTLIQNAISNEGGFAQLDIAAKMPRGNNYSLFLEGTTGTTLGDQEPVSDMVAAINYAAFYDVSELDLQYRPVQLGSLGVCSECADISDLISTSGNIWTVSNGLQLDIADGVISAAGFPLYPDPAKLPDVGPLIMKFVAMVHDPPSSTDPPFGLDCALYWCMYDWFDVSIVNFTVGATVEAINWTDMAATQTQYLQDDYIILTPPTCLDDYGDPYPSSSTCIKTIGPYSQAALQNYLGGFFTGSATRVFDTGGWNVSSAFIQVMLTTASTTTDLLGAYTTIIQNIAIEMTNKVRQQKMDGVHEDYAEGYTYLWIMKFHIRWAYMVIPALLVIPQCSFPHSHNYQERGS